jgi:hypothetical protein
MSGEARPDGGREAKMLLAFMPTLFFPEASAFVALLMWPLVLGNSLLNLFLIALLLASPVLCLVCAFVRPRIYFQAVGVVLLLQLELLAFLNDWIHAIRA